MTEFPEDGLSLTVKAAGVVGVLGLGASLALNAYGFSLLFACGLPFVAAVWYWNTRQRTTETEQRGETA